MHPCSLEHVVLGYHEIELYRLCYIFTMLQQDPMYHFGSERDLEDAVEVTRTPLNELRQEVTALKEDHQKEVEALKEEVLIYVCV